MTNELATKQMTELSSAIEKVLVQGDLSKLAPEQRVEYYRKVCESLGLNYLTRPFDYITLNGKLQLYARKDATDQLRRLYGVSIDECTREFVDNLIIVTAKGHDASGRTDVEVGVVNRGDMNGKLENAIMKANTKAKRRLTLSLVGLGWLDETEVETIPNAPLVKVNDAGEIEGTIAGQARIESKTVVVDNPSNNTPKEEKPVEAQEKPEFDEVEFLRSWTHRVGLPPMTLAEASEYTTSKGKPFAKCTVAEFVYMLNAYQKRIENPKSSQAVKDDAAFKLSAINEILTAKASAQKALDAPKDPFVEEK